MKIKNLKPDSRSTFKQGYYNLINPEKYIGDPTRIIYRSSWERKFCIYCDTNPKIEKWSSEPFRIQYLSQWDNKIHSYYPDFYMKTIDGQEFIVEVKPKKYSIKPTPPKRKTKKAEQRYADEVKQYVINQSKWKATHHVSEEKGYKFRVITEDFLNTK